MKKPFYRFPIFVIERHKFNPLRFIFGKFYVSSNFKKWYMQQYIDVKDIEIVEKESK